MLVKFENCEIQQKIGAIEEAKIGTLGSGIDFVVPPTV